MKSSKLNRKAYRDIIIVSGIRGAGLISVIIFQATISQLFGPSTLGYSMIAWMVVSVVSTTSRLGIDVAVVRLISSNFMPTEHQQRSDIIHAALLLGTLFGALGGLALWLASLPLSTTYFNKPQITPILSVMSAAIVPSTLSAIISGILNGCRFTWLAVAMQNLIPISLTTIGMLLLPDSLGPNRISIGFAGGWVITLGIGLTALWRLGTFRSFSLSPIPFRALYSSASHLAISQIVNQLILWLPLIVAGHYLVASDVGILSISLRIGITVSFLLMSISIVLAPTYGRLFRENRIDEIQSIARTTARYMGAISSLVFLILVWTGPYILTVAGVDPDPGYRVLLIIAAGQLTNSLSGSVGYLLNMSGNEAATKQTSITTLILSLPTILIFVKTLGATGAALGAAFSVVAINLLMIVALKRRTGISSLPF